MYGRSERVLASSTRARDFKFAGAAVQRLKFHHNGGLNSKMIVTAIWLVLLWTVTYTVDHLLSKHLGNTPVHISEKVIYVKYHWMIQLHIAQ